ncbi:MAG TPA: phosphatase PAP2 family protein [Thermomicrobiales bacterium]|nr:phosphatase PAP2 family protein [Thermomicrobiales bacterium]
MISVARPVGGNRATAFPTQAESHTRAPRITLGAAGMFFGTVAMLLTALAIYVPQAWLDVWTINRVQEFDAPYLHEAITAVSTLTSSTGAIALWAIALVAFTVSRKWLPALAMLVMPVGGVLNQVIGELIVGRTRPDGTVVERTVPDIQAASFPSGHVMGAVMFYGLIFFLARKIENTVLRVSIQSFSVAIVTAVGFARIWEGAHWPSDVVGAYAWGGLFLVALFAAYNRIETVAGHLPFIHAGEIAHDEERRHTHALTSVVFFNDDTVSKVYNPGFLPRALYWLSFQAPFPYVANRRALEAAKERRNLAAMLTEYWYGESRVARVTGIDIVEGNLAVTSELVDGHEPANRAAAKHFLRDLRARFEQAGLPTWQIDPRQPRAVDNVLETADGSYMIVDLESGLVSPLASLKSWTRAIRRGHAPIFDTVYFDVTRDYVTSEAASIRAIKGDAWLVELEATLTDAEQSANAWYASEPRLWSKLIDVRNWKPRAEKAVAGGQEKAMGWLTTSVDMWEAEGRISDAEAIRLRSEMETPQFQAVVPHLGAHVGISILLRFPLGSIARAGWSAVALLGATGRLMARRIDFATWKQAFSIHNPVVIALAAIPGFGAFAYLAAGPIRKNRLLMRLTVDAVMFKMPWRLYERTGMRRVMVIGRSAGSHAAGTATEAAQSPFEPTTSRQPVTLPAPAYQPTFVPSPVMASSMTQPLHSYDAAAWD